MKITIFKSETDEESVRGLWQSKMKIYEVKKRDEALSAELLVVWESSVRATHDFLSDTEVKRIKDYVPKALYSAKHLTVAENDLGKVLAFAGAENGRLEMLFVLPSETGKGIGKALLCHTVRNFGVRELAVNEQNLNAVGFYNHLGFEPYKRTDLDEQRNPYPLLYMKHKDR